MTTYAAQTTNSKAPDWARQQSRLCGAIQKLKEQLDQQHPDRDRTSDGFIGDKRHLAAGERSDHNPWWHNLVRAGDFDKDGINAPWLAEQLRLTGLAGDQRLADGGYIIWDGQITSPDFRRWTPYLGDPHTGHVHVSAARRASCDDTAPWAFLEVATPVVQAGDPGPIRPAAPTSVWTGPDAVGAGDTFRANVGDNGPKVLQLQAELNRIFPAYSQLEEDGFYGPRTGAVLDEFAQRAAQDPHTPEGDRAGLAQSDGQNVGPRIARAFGRYGLNV